MSSPTPIQIHIDEDFPHLSHAPIVEAVIDLRARPGEKLEEQACRSALEPQLQSYQYADSRREYVTELELAGSAPPSQMVRDLGWKGLRFRSEDQKHLAQFNRDGFVFSRLEPYVNWGQLEGETFRLWTIFQTLAKPVEVERIGLRFINRIYPRTADFQLEDYLLATPQPPRGLDLPFQSFVHQDTLAVPGHPYGIRVIRTIQHPVGGSEERVAVIVDIDVFTTQATEMNDRTLRRRLSEMRWLKNKVFFGSVTEKALEGSN